MNCHLDSIHYNPLCVVVTQPRWNCWTALKTARSQLQGLQGQEGGRRLDGTRNQGLPTCSSAP